MGSGEARRRLIVTADDFGRSTSINQAVIRAHHEGILTCASLMAGGEAFDEAVELAKSHPQLGVGLHLTLCCGRPVLPPGHIPDLVDEAGQFSACPITAGLNFFFNPAARVQLEKEIQAQLEKFLSTGLTLDHLNGHLHFHLHPTVFSILKKFFSRFRVRAVRLTREPWELNFLQFGGRWGYRLSHAAIFEWLAARVAGQLKLSGICAADQVFGLLQDGRVNEDYLLQLLPDLPLGISELYAHPSMEEEQELDAFTSRRVAEAVRRHGVKLIRYQDLCSNC